MDQKCFINDISRRMTMAQNEVNEKEAAIKASAVCLSLILSGFCARVYVYYSYRRYI